MTSKGTKHIIIGISGASGAVYGVRLLEQLRPVQSVSTHLIVSKTAQLTLKLECGLSASEVASFADYHHPVSDLSACISSGSYHTEAMIIAPCSMRSLAEIAHGMTSNLLTRAADVCLKERRRLVVLPRETPLNASHLKNMLAVTEMGGIIAPPVPAFYNHPNSLDDIVDHTVGRVLDLINIDINHKVERWTGMKPAPADA